jgi:hypothetical protein
LIAGGVAFKYVRPFKDSTRRQLITAGQMFVRQALDGRLRSAFAGEEETVVETLPDNKFLISGWVDLITEQGKPNRQNFSCVVYRNGNGNWVGEHISVIPQM